MPPDSNASRTLNLKSHPYTPHQLQKNQETVPPNQSVPSSPNTWRKSSSTIMSRGTRNEGKRYVIAACISLLAGAVAASEDAMAAEYCVSCTGPAGLYRCVIADSPDGAGNDPAERLKCATDLAERAEHETCRVSKSAPVPCPGQTIVIAAPIEPPPPPPGALPTELDESEPTATPEKPGEVPKTVEKLAEKTYQSTKQGIQDAGNAVGKTAKKAGDAIVDTAKNTGETIENAGKAVGGAAKKTWDCLTSLFSDC